MTSFLPGRLTLIILAAIVGLLVFDVREHGSFKASRTNKFLTDSGALHYGEIAWSNFRSYSQQGYRWCQKNVPVYTTKIRESAAPYLRMALDWLTTLAQLLWSNIKLLYAYFLEKKPLVEQWINQYAPGVVDAVGSGLRQVRDYVVFVASFVWRYLVAAAQWMKDNVFVGSLSPESLHRYTMDALNTTHKLAAQTFSWLNDKVVTVSSAS